MKRLFWFFVLVAMLTCAQHAKAQPPAAGAVRSGQTQVQNATNGNCLYNNAGVLGNQPCGAGGGVTSVSAGTGISVNQTTGAVIVTNTSPGAPPAGSAGSCQFRLNGTTFTYDVGCVDYPTGIPDPAMAPPVTVVTTGMTTRTYSIIETNGVGWTLPSPSTTVTNSSDGAINDKVTVPTETDPNIYCIIFESVSSTATINPCDGSQVTFGSQTPVPGVPNANRTAGVVLPGGIGVNPLLGFNTASWGGSWNANSLLAPAGPGVYFVDILGNFIAGLNTQSPTIPGVSTQSGQPLGAYHSGFWEQVDTVKNADSPFTITESNGIIKCDTASGNVTLNLPVTNVLPTRTAFQTGYGRQFIIKKPVAANSCTITTTDSTTINGAATYVLTATNSSVQLYWDGNSDGNTGMWATQSSDVGSVGSATAAACWINTHTLGHCTSVVGAGGTCTCTQ